MTKNNVTITAESGDVFERLGTVVRSLHEALRELGAEQVLAEAASEFPSARERLLHIGRLTEKAANTVLSKVEERTPIQESLAEQASNLCQAWQAPATLDQVPEPLRAFTDKTIAFLKKSEVEATMMRAALSDMMMAQDFQDLTGQLIQKVVSVLEHTENDLLKLLIDAAPPGAISEVKKEEIMAGPGAPGGVALEQGAVDDLLADLGF